MSLNRVQQNEPTQKENFHKFSKVTVFATLLIEVLMGCKDIVLPDPVIKKCSVKCLPLEEKTRKPYNNN